MESKIRHDTIVISDLHLGSPMCQTKELLCFLQNIEVKRLVLNGDVFEDLNRTFRLHRQHWAILEQLRKMSDNCEVVWIKGNHDSIYKNKKEDLVAISNLLGIKIKYQLIFDVNGHKILAIHGDKWDGYLYKYPVLNNFVTWIYDRLKQTHSGITKRMVRWIKRKSKLLMRNGKYVMDGAVDYAHDLEVKMVICGHTHQIKIEKIDEIIYANCGTWESFTPSYVSIDENCTAIWQYENGKPTLFKSIEL
jgi:UDP-2,3-diacylglucosamine pyrophosphatase LpxH